MGESTEIVGMLVVSPITGEIFISKKDCWEDDEPIILGKPWRLGMDEKRAIKTTSGQVEGSCSISISLCTS